jgi:hypothetical protein
MPPAANFAASRYGKRPDLSAEVFVGAEVSSVNFYSNQVVLRFGAHLSLRVMAGYSYALRGRSKTVYGPPESVSRLMGLADKRVCDGRLEDSGALSLFFEDGSRFSCYLGPPAYESYAVTIGEREVFV